MPIHRLGMPFLLVLTALGCDDTKSAVATPTASATATATAPVEKKPRIWRKMPFMTVDIDGVNIGGERADLSRKPGRTKLAGIVKRLPLQGDDAAVPVVTALKKAKTRDVAWLVNTLGDGGAAQVVLKTDGRGDLPKQVTLLPRGRLSNPAACSVVVTTRADLSTAVWSLKGGTARTHRKGLAGPDLSNTETTLAARVKRCDSKTAFFSSASKLTWQMTYNMGALIVKVDTDKKIDKLVLLGEEPVAGRPLKLGL